MERKNMNRDLDIYGARSEMAQRRLGTQIQQVRSI